FSHTVTKQIPEGLKVELPKPTNIIISGIDKQLVGEFAANLRDIRRPSPYSGKGIMYKDEVIRRKEGKTAAK
ncbi:ribosomal L6 family protein, partial [Chlamydia psittaci 01DC11]